MKERWPRLSEQLRQAAYLLIQHAQHLCLSPVPTAYCRTVLRRKMCHQFGNTIAL